MREVANAVSPLVFDYSKAFGITARQAAIFALPGLIGSAFAFMFSFSRQLRALAQSGTGAPHFLSENISGRNDCCTMFLLRGCAAALVVMLSSWFIQPGSIEILFHAALLGSYLSYIAVFACFVIFHIRYKRLARYFENSLGCYSVADGAVVFSIAFIALAAFQRDHYVTFTEIAVASLFYFLRARHAQK